MSLWDLLGFLHIDFESWLKNEIYYLFSELINFENKIILEKSRIDILATKNTSRPLKIWEKLLETVWNMMNLNKVFKSHEKIVKNLEHKD